MEMKKYATGCNISRRERQSNRINDLQLDFYENEKDNVAIVKIEAGR